MTAAVTAKLVPVAAPMTGVTSVGLVDKTTLPVPVDVVTPVPPRATVRVPVVPATIGSPVALASDVVLNKSALVSFLVVPL